MLKQTPCISVQERWISTFARRVMNWKLGYGSSQFQKRPTNRAPPGRPTAASLQHRLHFYIATDSFGRAAVVPLNSQIGLAPPPGAMVLLKAPPCANDSSNRYPPRNVSPFRDECSRTSNETCFPRCPGFGSSFPPFRQRCMLSL